MEKNVLHNENLNDANRGQSQEPVNLDRKGKTSGSKSHGSGEGSGERLADKRDVPTADMFMKSKKTRRSHGTGEGSAERLTDKREVPTGEKSKKTRRSHGTGEGSAERLTDKRDVPTSDPLMKSKKTRRSHGSGEGSAERIADKGFLKDFLSGEKFLRSQKTKRSRAAGEGSAECLTDKNVSKDAQTGDKVMKSQTRRAHAGEGSGERVADKLATKDPPPADKGTKSQIGSKIRRHPLRSVPERLITNITVDIPWKGGLDFALQVNSYMQIVQAPKHKELSDHLDLGDILVRFNEIDVPDKRLLRTVMEQFNKENLDNKETEVKLVIKRMKYTETLPPNSPKIPPVIEIQGSIFNYLQGYMMLLPQSSVGMKIKTYNSKVYVTSTDNGFFCVAKRTLLVGDAILAVDDKPVANNKECGTMITNALGDRGFVSLVIERPADALEAGPLVRAALMADKQQELDPRMADDVVEICRQEILNRQPDVLIKHDNVKPILRVKKGRSKQNIGFKDTSTEFTIDMDPINPLLLRRVPPPAERMRGLNPQGNHSQPIGTNSGSHQGPSTNGTNGNGGHSNGQGTKTGSVKKGTWQSPTTATPSKN